MVNNLETLQIGLADVLHSHNKFKMKSHAVFVRIFVPTSIEELILHVLIISRDIKYQLFIPQAVFFAKLGDFIRLLDFYWSQKYFVRDATQLILQDVQDVR